MDESRAWLDEPAQLTIEPFFGWRVWAVTVAERWEEASGPVLRGAWGRIWPGPEVEARCLHPPTRCEFAGLLNRRERCGHQEPVPHPPCRCGIYARHPEGPEDRWTIRIAGMPRAGGFIRMWGTVIEGSNGYRARWGRIDGPLELVVPCSGERGSQLLCDRAPSRVARQGNKFFGLCGSEGHDPFPEDEVYELRDWLDAVVPSLEERYCVPVVALEEGAGEGHR